ncbi:MAG: transcription antitermination factor NusB [Clostridia bacterium]|nr:transcription antitermination factor NusB [Clostridia bacterium]
MGRRNARKLAFYLLFQYDFADAADYEEVKNTFLTLNEEEMTDNDRNYVIEKTDGTMANIDRIDEIIGNYAIGWSVDRLSKVDKAILRLAVYEIKFAPDVPDGVAVNEAVELAKTYSSDEAPAFINGILGKVLGSEENA